MQTPKANTKKSEPRKRITVFPLNMNTLEAADYLGLSRQYLEIGRHSGYGPRYVKLARAVRYRKSDLDDWMASHLRQHTAEPSNTVGK